MVLSKLDLALVALLMAALLWIEHDNRVVTGSLAAVGAVPATVAACPATDDVPFSADCIASINAALPAAVQLQTGGAASDRAPAPDANAPACPPEYAGDGTQCLRVFPDGASAR